MKSTENGVKVNLAEKLSKVHEQLDCQNGKFRAEIETLEELYLGDVRLLATWLQCWMARNQEFLTNLLKQTAVAHDLLKCEVKKSPIRKEQCRSQLLTIASLTDEFWQSLDQLGDKMTKVIDADEPKDPSFSGRFPLSPDGRLHLAKRRHNLVDSTFLATKAQLQCWLTEGMPEWAAMNRYFRTFISTNFRQELAQCSQGIISCNQRSVQCQKLMSRCATKLSLREI